MTKSRPACQVVMVHKHVAGEKRCKDQILGGLVRRTCPCWHSMSNHTTFHSFLGRFKLPTVCFGWTSNLCSELPSLTVSYADILCRYMTGNSMLTLLPGDLFDGFGVLRDL